jgi:hypothetical protein
MKAANVMTIDHLQVPLKIIYKGIGGIKRYKIIPSADKSGITINKDD